MRAMYRNGCAGEVISSLTIFYNKREGKPCKQTRFNSMLMVSLPSKMKRKESLLIIQFIKLKTSKPREFSPLQHTRNKLALVQQTSSTYVRTGYNITRTSWHRYTLQHSSNKLTEVQHTAVSQATKCKLPKIICLSYIGLVCTLPNLGSAVPSISSQ